MAKIKELFLKYKEIICYIFVGGITTLVRWGTTAIFEKILLPFNMDELVLSIVVTVLSLIVTILFAFPPNKLIVFESKSFAKGIIGKEFVSFISARAAASLIELVGVPAITKIFGISNLFATMMVSIVVLVANYIFSKLFIFKKRTDNSEDKKQNEKEIVEAQAKDKTIALVLMIICAVVAVVSIGFFAVETIISIISAIS